MDTATQISDVIDFIKDAQAKLQIGEVVSLDKFDEKVKTIAGNIIALDPDKRSAITDKLEMLNSALRDFEIDLRARQAEVKQDIMSLNQKKKVMSAYENVSHSTKKESE
jgi:hypothetical protein